MCYFVSFGLAKMFAVCYFVSFGLAEKDVCFPVPLLHVPAAGVQFNRTGHPA